MLILKMWRYFWTKQRFPFRTLVTAGFLFSLYFFPISMQRTFSSSTGSEDYNSPYAPYTIQILINRKWKRMLVPEIRNESDIHHNTQQPNTLKSNVIYQFLVSRLPKAFIWACSLSNVHFSRFWVDFHMDFSITFRQHCKPFDMYLLAIHPQCDSFWCA